MDRHRRWRDGVVEQLGPRMDDLQRASISTNGNHAGGLATIGLVGYAIERLIFQPIERRTVVRWGMLHR